MLAKTNQYIEEAVATVRQLTQEEKIRQQCEAREDYYRRTAGREERLKRTTQELKQAEAELDQAVAERDQATAERDKAIAERDQATAERDQALTVQKRLQQLLEKYGIDINETTDSI